MRAIHVTEGIPVTMTRGSIVLIFDPKEIEVAIWTSELLASTLEEKAKERCKTDDLWEFAYKLRNFYKSLGRDKH